MATPCGFDSLFRHQIDLDCNRTPCCRNSKRPALSQCSIAHIRAYPWFLTGCERAHSRSLAWLTRPPRSNRTTPSRTVCSLPEAEYARLLPRLEFSTVRHRRCRRPQASACRRITTRRKSRAFVRNRTKRPLCSMPHIQISGRAQEWRHKLSLKALRSNCARHFRRAGGN